ncbi:hypothetical protein HDU84_004773 [Entophlyctis sp. JEL0112]|nr:hypothetical protein HDU84_004773 [Entophlyctis sp. JEL0112]
MISLHVGTMLKSALWLKEELEKRGVTVWICSTELEAGANYRDEIFNAVKSCRVMIPFVNKRWSDSGECEYEFQLAVRTNLISHDSGATHRTITIGNGDSAYTVPGIRRPAFLPIKFPDIEWTENPGIEQLSCVTNFVVCDAPSLVADTNEQYGAASSGPLLKVIHGLRALGIAVKRLPADPEIIPLPKRAAQSSVHDPVDLAQQVIAGIQMQLQNAQDLFTLVSLGSGRAHPRRVGFGGAESASLLNTFDASDLDKKYLGYCTNDRDGCEVLWALEFTIDLSPSDAEMIIPATGSVVVSVMSANDTTNSMVSKQKEAEYNEYARLNRSATAHLRGSFNRRRGLVVLDAFEKEDEFSLIRLCKYRIILVKDSKVATGLFHPKPDELHPHGIHDDNEWTAVVKLIATK